MACFDKAVDFFIKNEGGYSNNPNDPGGETKYGIAKRYHPNIDIKNLSIDGAKKILYDDYWLPHRYKELINNDLATRVFDFAGNSGYSDSAKTLQTAIVSMGIALVVDGVMGSKTIAAANRLYEKLLIANFKIERCKWYQKQVEKYPKKIENLSGWIKRACL